MPICLTKPTGSIHFFCIPFLCFYYFYFIHSDTSKIRTLWLYLVSFFSVFKHRFTHSERFIKYQFLFRGRILCKRESFNSFYLSLQIQTQLYCQCNKQSKGLEENPDTFSILSRIERFTFP